MEKHIPVRDTKDHSNPKLDNNDTSKEIDQSSTSSPEKHSQSPQDSPEIRNTVPFIDSFNRKIDQFQEIEIPKRGMYPHHVEVTEIGSLLTWTFSTRRKNIAFGLFYQPIIDSHLKILPDQYRIVFHNLSEEDFKVTPGPMDRTILERPKFISKDSTQSHEMSDKVSIASSTKGKLGILRKISSSASTLAKNSKKLYRESTINYGHDSNIQIHDDIEPEEPIIDVLPIQKYESYRYQVTGYLRVPLSGHYIFVFDNSFSVHTSKQVFYHIEQKPASFQLQRKPSHNLPKGSPKSTSTSPTSSKSESESDISIATWLLKRNKNRIQGWTKRWVEIRKGILSWYDEPGGELHESIPLASCIVTKIPHRRKLIFDSGATVFYFQALNEQDYINWVDIILSFKNMKYDKTFLSVMSELPKKANNMVGEMNICKEKLEECTNIAMQIANRSEEKMNLKEEKISEQVASIISLLSESIDKLKIVLEQTNSQFVLLNNGIKHGSNGRFKASHGRFLSMAHRRERSVDSMGPDAFFDADDVIDLEGISSSEDDSDSFIDDELKRDAITSESSVGTKEQKDTIPYTLPDLKSIESDMIISSPNISLPKDDITRRTSLPNGMVENTASFVSILRKNIGKDFSGISMPVCVNDPLNVLQRLCEEMEYSNLLIKACHLNDPIHRLAYVAAFAVSGYAFTKYRSERKPFNPLLGETFECVRKDLGFSFVAEKVSHQPPVMACYATGGEDDHKYEFWQDLRVKSKFWGKSMEFSPIGHCYLRMRGDYYSWKKVISCIRNIYGTPWVEHYGELKITNHSTGDTCVLFFRKEKGFFASSCDTSVDGFIQDGNSNTRYKLKGNWSECLYLFEGNNHDGKRRVKSSTQLEAKSSDRDSGTEAYSDTSIIDSSSSAIKSQLLWMVNPMPPNHQLSYGYTSLSLTLNEMLPDRLMNNIPFTDTRRRPDQRAFEQGDVELAEIIKKKLEGMQRNRRKLLDSESHPWTPKWFVKMIDPITNNEYYQFTGKYWEHCKNMDFDNDLVLFPSGLDNLENIDVINES